MRWFARIARRDLVRVCRVLYRYGPAAVVCNIMITHRLFPAVLVPPTPRRVYSRHGSSLAPGVVGKRERERERERGGRIARRVWLAGYLPWHRFPSTPRRHSTTLVLYSSLSSTTAANSNLTTLLQRPCCREIWLLLLFAPSFALYPPDSSRPPPHPANFRLPRRLCRGSSCVVSHTISAPLLFLCHPHPHNSPFHLFSPSPSSLTVARLGFTRSFFFFFFFALCCHVNELRGNDREQG